MLHASLATATAGCGRHLAIIKHAPDTYSIALSSFRDYLTVAVRSVGGAGESVTE